MNLAKEMLQHGIRDAEARLKEFASELETNPVSALSWSASAFEAAATKQVFSHVIKLLDDKAYAVVTQLVQREVMLGAKRGSRSTSETANLMNAELMTAWARALEALRYSP